MTTLTQLANQYNSDQGDQVGCCQRDASLYEKILAPYRNQPITFLEIGLQREFCQHKPDCPSLRMWLEFFPQAAINGFDISDFSDVELPRARIFQGDQGNEADLKRVTDETGPLDVIIDDGSHASAHQQITLAALFPHLKPGGLYIIEDAHWQPERDAERRDGIESMLTIFKRFAIYGQPIKSRYLSDKLSRQIEHDIARCTFSHPFVDDAAPAPQPRSAVKELARRVLKGKRPQTDDRRFKLIILEKRSAEDAPGCETVTSQMTCNAV